MYIEMQAKEQITLYSTGLLYTSITILEFIKHVLCITVYPGTFDCTCYVCI